MNTYRIEFFNPDFGKNFYAWVGADNESQAREIFRQRYRKDLQIIKIELSP